MEYVAIEKSEYEQLLGTIKNRQTYSQQHGRDQNDPDTGA